MCICSTSSLNKQDSWEKQLNFVPLNPQGGRVLSLPLVTNQSRPQDFSDYSWFSQKCNCHLEWKTQVQQLQFSIARYNQNFPGCVQNCWLSLPPQLGCFAGRSLAFGLSRLLSSFFFSLPTCYLWFLTSLTAKVGWERRKWGGKALVWWDSRESWSRLLLLMVWLA